MMETGVQVFAMVNFVIIGLSHIIQPRVWAAFFIGLCERGHAGVFVNGFISLGLGSLIVAFHNVWSGLPMVLTIYGWILVLKALISFTAPSIAKRSMAQVSHERASHFVFPGIGLLLLGALLCFHLVTKGNG